MSEALSTELKSFADLVGHTLARIERATDGDGDRLIFVLDYGDRYIQYHGQDCCESVYIEDVIGDLRDLIGMPILLAEEVTSNENPKDNDEGSHTWTFYKLSTNLGSVTIRWYGTSNGYYSESVDWKKE